jgi:hypothetical protein
LGFDRILPGRWAANSVRGDGRPAEEAQARAETLNRRTGMATSGMIKERTTIRDTVGKVFDRLAQYSSSFGGVAQASEDILHVIDTAAYKEYDPDLEALVGKLRWQLNKAYKEKLISDFR